MDPIIIVAIACLVVGFTIFLILSSRRQTKRESKAIAEFATFLDSGSVIEGNKSIGPRAIGKWKGHEISIGWFCRGGAYHPTFITQVTINRVSSPLVALIIPRNGKPRDEREPLPPNEVPSYVKNLDENFKILSHPKDSFLKFCSEPIANVIAELENSEIEILPNNLNISLLRNIYETAPLVPLLNCAVQFTERLNALQKELLGSNEEEFKKRTLECEMFLSNFRT